jgi:hypothetical protein
MARPEDMRKSFERNMNRLRKVDGGDLLFYTGLSIIFLLFVGVILAYALGEPATLLLCFKSLSYLLSNSSFVSSLTLPLLFLFEYCLSYR